MHFPIIYLHIPKTAGTSFRVSANDYFGKENILSDYGEDSEATSPDILNGYYHSDDPSALYDAGKTKKFMSGHFYLAKYRNIFPDSPVVTFFRDPVKRVLSEYVHFKNHFNYSGSLEDFYRSTQFQNKQHHTLSGAKPTDLDFYGLTERYSESLDLFNQRYQARLPITKLNKGNYRGKTDTLATDKQIEEIKQLNRADIAVYQCAVDNFQQQDKHTKPTSTIANRYHGNFGGIRNDKLVGWTFEYQSSEAVKIHVAVNDRHCCELVANKFRADLQRQNLHTDGHCGFELSLSKLGSISAGDSISVRTADGEFELLNSPYIIR